MRPSRGSLPQPLLQLNLLASLSPHPGTVGTGSLRLQMRRLRAPSLSENSLGGDMGGGGKGGERSLMSEVETWEVGKRKTGEQGRGAASLSRASC